MAIASSKQPVGRQPDRLRDGKMAKGNDERNDTDSTAGQGPDNALLDRPQYYNTLNEDSVD